MDTQEKTFGQLLTQFRSRNNYTLRGFAKTLGITPAYLNDVEKGRRKPFSIEIINKASSLLDLSSEETEMLLDLAGSEHQTIAPDVIQYISSNSQFATAFRKARDMNVTEDEWMEMLKDLEERRKK